MSNAIQKIYLNDDAQNFNGKQGVYKTCLMNKDTVLATHKELAELRRCSDLVRAEPNRKLYIVTPEQRQRTNFIVKTLLHLGVSCGQIAINWVKPASSESDGIWLMVAND